MYNSVIKIKKCEKYKKISIITKNIIITKVYYIGWAFCILLGFNII